MGVEKDQVVFLGAHEIECLFWASTDYPTIKLVQEESLDSIEVFILQLIQAESIWNKEEDAIGPSFRLSLLGGATSFLIGKGGI